MSSLASPQYVLLDMTTHGRTSGVDRYLQQLTLYLEQECVPYLRVSLVERLPGVGVRVAHEGAGTWLQLPLPSNIREVLGAERWTEHYNEEVIHLLEPYLDQARPTILHIHTLNLIDLAHSLKQWLCAGVILSHLHCIPWKGYLNSHRERFHRLYALYYKGGVALRSSFFTGGYEERTLALSDHIVAVTACGGNFLQRMAPSCPYSVIPNGLEHEEEARDYSLKERLRLLFVGSLSAGKGLEYVLQALQLLQPRLALPVQLVAAGAKSSQLEARLRMQYPELDLELCGDLPQAELGEHYRAADIGIIASLQEQCSYAALEMMRASLPIVTTAVDGLEELFVGQQHALKVPVHYDRLRGLRPEVAVMADCIQRLASDEALRRQLGRAARARYEEHYTLRQMGDATQSLYNTLLSP